MPAKSAACMKACMLLNKQTQNAKASCQALALGGHQGRPSLELRTISAWRAYLQNSCSFAAQGSLPGEWFSRGSFPELRALVLSYGPLDTPDLRAPKYGAIGGQLPDVSGGALRNLQVRVSAINPSW